MNPLMEGMLKRARAKAKGDVTVCVTLRTVSLHYYPVSGTHTWFNRTGPISSAEAEAELLRKHGVRYA